MTRSPTESCATDTMGPPSLLVNNAGIAELGALVDVTIDSWWDVLRVNLPVAWTKAVLPVMRQQRRGVIGGLLGHCAVRRSLDRAEPGSRGRLRSGQCTSTRVSWNGSA
jgi:NAD(P)-dependent dehydrogenase (short-subunit alcohol dehydrogenase family)